MAQQEAPVPPVAPTVRAPAPANPVPANPVGPVNPANPPRPQRQFGPGSEPRFFAAPDGQFPQKVKCTYLGVAAEGLSDEVRAQLPLQKPAGLQVMAVVPGSPAEEAGIKKGDVLTRLDEHMLVHPEQLRVLIEAKQPGDTVNLAFFRTGKEQSAQAKLAEHERDTYGDWGALGNVIRQSAELGIRKAEEARELGRRAAEEARRAAEDAARDVRAHRKSFEEFQKDLVGARDQALEELGRANDGKVTIIGKTVSTVSDPKGTYGVVEADDGKQSLIAVDKSGNLLFKGEVETEVQRAKVPPEILKKVEQYLRPAKKGEEKSPENPGMTL